MNRLLNYTSCVILVSFLVFFLVIGSSVLIPLVVAIIIWYIINSISTAIRKVPYFKQYCPEGLSLILSVGFLGILTVILCNILNQNIAYIISEYNHYKINLLTLSKDIENKYHIALLSSLQSAIETLNIQSILLKVYEAFTALASSLVIIVLYVLFLFVEQHFFHSKIKAIASSEQRVLFFNILKRVVDDTQIYFGIKTVLGFVTACLSWIVMKKIGLDLAGFWALLIFFLYFIPSIGAIVAVVLPALLSLVQFLDWWPCIIISASLMTIQIVIGNIIEPRFLSKSLNVSPLILLLALSAWGAIWGILGMILSVPITIMMMIIFAHFEKTRPIAIFLSQDGSIFHLYNSGDEGQHNWLI